MGNSHALGIDVGGTSIKAAAIGADGEAWHERRVATPRGDSDGRRTIGLLSRLVAEFTHRLDLTAVGIAVPGIVDETRGVVISAVNLGWDHLPLRDLLAPALDLTLVFGQDVRTGAFAEATRGAAAAQPGVSVFVPIGTGIAAGIIVDGRPLTSGGWAGEIGQIDVAETVERVDLPNRTLEEVASASAIATRLGVVDAREAAALVRSGDSRATRIWMDAISAIAEALAWTTAVTGAETIVVGGGLAGAGSVLIDPLEVQLRARLGVLRMPRLVVAAFGDRAAMVGAGLMARVMG